MAQDDLVRIAILDAAKRIFQRWGLNKSTMEDIAREAVKGKSTLYYYFKTKEELFDAVVTEAFNAVLQTARDAAEREFSAKDKLKRYIVVTIKESKEMIGLYTIVRDEVKRNHNFLDKLRQKFTEMEKAYIRQILTLGLRTKELAFISEDEITMATATILGVIHALELYLLLENDDTQQIDMAARMIINGI
ncbi:MAG TPA: helix-turn-helix domain-containing protein [bacterium]|nr:helix-turn-helix domain-containing protein [bacterium]